MQKKHQVEQRDNTQCETEDWVTQLEGEILWDFQEKYSIKTV